MDEHVGSILEQVRAVVADHLDERGALLPILHDLQQRFGHVDQGWIPTLATELNMSRADVHGVISFYTDFRPEPSRATTVRVCRAEACQSMGSERLVSDAEQVFGVKLGQTTSDGSVRLDQVFCLGNCALAPGVQIENRTYGRMDNERLVAVLADGQRHETTQVGDGDG